MVHVAGTICTAIQNPVNRVAVQLTVNLALTTKLEVCVRASSCHTRPRQQRRGFGPLGFAQQQHGSRLG